MKKGKAGLLSVLAIGSVAVIGFMAANEASNKNSRTISTTTSAITTFESTSISSLDNTEYTTLFESNTTETYSEGTSLSSTYDTTAPEINEENSLIAPSEQSELVPTIETTQAQETEEISASPVNADTNIISVSEVVSGVNLVDSSTNQLRFHFIDVGQGDSTFIELPNGKSMLIDAGEIDQGDKVVAYIYEQGYDTVNYVVATHAHSDHIGGLPQVLSNFNVDEVIMTEDKNDTQIFSNLFTAIYVNGATLHYVMAGDTIISEGDLLVEVVAPKVLVSDDYNNNSVVIKITYGNTKFLFTGDAEKSEEDGIWTNIKCDLLKVGHHGSKSSSSANFLKKVNPTYAIISCGLYNSYGHPTDEVLQRLNERKIKTYRTDLQGTILVTSDGKTISINKEPVDFNQSVTTTTVEQAVVTSSENGQETIYVLNTNTKKIHYSWCSSVKDMKDKNKDFTNDYSAAIAAGYKPCGRCHPTG